MGGEAALPGSHLVGAVLSAAACRASAVIAMTINAVVGLSKFHVTPPGPPVVPQGALLEELLELLALIHLFNLYLTRKIPLR